MKAIDLQTEKLELINWIYQLKDSSLLEQLKLFKTEKEEASIDIPQWQKDLVRKRIKSTKEEDYLSWEEIQSKLTFK